MKEGSRIGVNQWREKGKKKAGWNKAYQQQVNQSHQPWGTPVGWAIDPHSVGQQFAMSLYHQSLWFLLPYTTLRRPVCLSLFSWPAAVGAGGVSPGCAVCGVCARGGPRDIVKRGGGAHEGRHSTQQQGRGTAQLC